MSHIKIKNFKQDKKNLAIRVVSASSNVRDYNDRLIFNEKILKFKDINEYNMFLADFADSILNGYYKIQKGHSMEKRINLLKEKKLLTYKPLKYDMMDIKVNRNNPLTFEILNGSVKK